jgi:hypothetical protein
MRAFTTSLIVVFVLFSATSFAQSDAAATANSAAALAVPPLVKFTGSVDGGARSQTMTFALYRVPTDGQPLWTETQTVDVGSEGHYAVLLGGVHPLRPSLFAAGEERWLGVTPQGGTELPRVPFISVPYAMKAADAQTIAGRPLSAFILAGDKTGTAADGLTYVNPTVRANALAGGAAVSTTTAGPPSPQSGSGAAGTANYVGMFTDGSNLGNSAIYQTPAGRIGINTTAPAAPLHLAANESPAVYFDAFSGSGSTALGALPGVYRAARGTMTAPLAQQKTIEELRAQVDALTRAVAALKEQKH